MQTNNQIDHLLSILRRAPRRHTLRLLQSHTNLALADLADEIARRTHDEPLTGIPAESVRDIYLQLYHSHIPALVDTGFLTYDQEQDRVTITKRGTTIDLEAVHALAAHHDESGEKPG
jgi:hypothetical protein